MIRLFLRLLMTSGKVHVMEVVNFFTLNLGGVNLRIN